MGGPSSWASWQGWIDGFWHGAAEQLLEFRDLVQIETSKDAAGGNESPVPHRNLGHSHQRGAPDPAMNADDGVVSLDGEDATRRSDAHRLCRITEPR